MYPSHYKPSNCNWDYNPDIQKLFESATQFKKANPMKSSGADAFKTHLLLIDVQKDFCFPEGTLYVGGRSGTGAVDDSRRTAEFIYRNVDRLTSITTTLDTHFAYQIFFPWFWVGEDFGFGFYLAASYSQTFTFGLKKKSFNDSCKIRIEGKLIDSNVYFGKDRAWVFISAQIRSNTVNRCWVIDKTGAILAQEEVNQSEDSWLSSIKGKMAIGNIMFSASDRGITRIEVVNGRVMPVKEFPDTEPFVLDNSYLFPEKSGIYVVDSLEIKKLEIG